MLNIEKLRVGNLIYFNGNTEEHIQRIIYINGDNIQIKQLSRWVNIKSILPIPLTENWILKLGCKKQGNIKRYKIKGLIGEVTILCNPLSYIYYRKNPLIVIHLNHLHYFQNLLSDLKQYSINKLLPNKDNCLL